MRGRLIGKLGGDRHAGRVVERVVQGADGHVRDADVIDAVRPIPPHEVGEVEHRASPQRLVAGVARLPADHRDRKSTRLNSSHVKISYAVFCLKKKKNASAQHPQPTSKKLKTAT